MLKFKNFVADYVKEPAKYQGFDEKWYEQKLQDSLTPYFYVFKNFLKALEFNEQKDLMWKCLDLAFNNSQLGLFKNDFTDFIIKSDANNFDELLKSIFTFIRIKVCDISSNRLEQIPILTQLFGVSNYY